MKRSIEAQFNRIAGEYDSGRRHFIPCFDSFYGETTEFAASFAGTPRKILDLGAGTGLLTMHYYRHFPDAQYLLVDIAEDMLAVARKRFSEVENVFFQTGDYSVELPPGIFDLVVSALSIHHLENIQKAELFQRIRQKLSAGSWFINYDQFCCDSPAMDEQVNKFWISHLYRSGLSETELARWQERRLLDRECSVPAELAMLRNSGFQNAECIYLCGKFAVIAAQASSSP